MPVFTQGDVPWNSLDDNIRIPTAGELEAGYPCGAADQQLFNFTTAYAWGQVHNAIKAGGLTIDRTDLTQLTLAIQAMIAEAIGNIPPPPDPIPVGSEIMWSGSAIPSGWFEQNGDAFDSGLYPLLAAHLGGNVLPDMRGEFVRGFDNGRGVDPGRALKSHQLDAGQAWSATQTLVRGQIGGVEVISGAIAHIRDGQSTANPGGAWAVSDIQIGPGVRGASRVANETRPRNVAKKFLIKHD